ncbi:hypothetical protein [Aneurinibacillus migulanus]|uniref:hypothetical protein n=1 Tax=Aneurinibacillus migulanus TaxID=47500 RepID=UPI000A45BD93|nr:hypothetical protein [Aneurinibacillus migulanus]
MMNKSSSSDNPFDKKLNGKNLTSEDIQMMINYMLDKTEERKNRKLSEIAQLQKSGNCEPKMLVRHKRVLKDLEDIKKMFARTKQQNRKNLQDSREE